MKKLVSILLCLVLCFSVLSLCSCGKDLPLIGICQFAEHPSLDNCYNGFLAGLEEAGLKKDVDFTIDYQTSGADPALSAQIAQNFSAKGAALMCGIATPSAQACFSAAEDKNIPVIFNAVSDPVAAHLDRGNVTGLSDKLPVTAQLALIRLCQPEATTIGIVYTTSEVNSVSAIAEYRAAAPEYGFTIDAIGISASDEVSQAVETLISHNVDCISNLTDNTVVNQLASILDKTDEAGIPVYGSEEEQVKMGCVATAGIDYFALGKQAGLMAAAVLKGEKTCEEMPFVTVTAFSHFVNSTAMAKFGITASPEGATDLAAAN